jgi:hypothetical protein
MKNRTTVDRKSERELVVTRTFNGPARIVFEAWTKPELLKRWDRAFCANSASGFDSRPSVVNACFRLRHSGATLKTLHLLRAK